MVACSLSSSKLKNVADNNWGVAHGLCKPSPVILSPEIANVIQINRIFLLLSRWLYSYSEEQIIYLVCRPHVIILEIASFVVGG